MGSHGLIWQLWERWPGSCLILTPKSLLIWYPHPSLSSSASALYLKITGDWMGMINFTYEQNITSLANEQLFWEHLPPLSKSNCEEVIKELAPSNKPNRVQNNRVRQRVKATGTEPRLHMEAIKAAKAQKAWPLTAFRYEPCVCTLDYIDATTQMITNALALETCSQENTWQCFHSSSVSIIAIEPNFSALDMIFI